MAIFCSTSNLYKWELAACLQATRPYDKQADIRER